MIGNSKVAEGKTKGKEEFREGLSSEKDLLAT